jgi:hypothetical protein
VVIAGATTSLAELLEAATLLTRSVAPLVAAPDVVAASAVDGDEPELPEAAVAAHAQRSLSGLRTAVASLPHALSTHA